MLVMELSQPTNIHAAVTQQLRAAGCVYAEDEGSLILDAAKSESELAARVEQRVSGLPLEHVVGWAEFCGQKVVVGPGVFVPRRRSEFLVSRRLSSLKRAVSWWI